jgi:hypothetical protein
VLGALALLWNSMGALDFTMTQLQSEVWLKAFTPEQVAFIGGFPLWSVIAWGLGTWGGALGSLALLLRRKLAVQLFAASLVGIVLTNLYCYGFSDWLKVMKGGTGAVVFSAAIFVIGVLLLVYARALRRRGVLR